jgi:uncharacterized protein (TIGR03437 family)
MRVHLMVAARAFAAVISLAGPIYPEGPVIRAAPAYSSDSLVNSASNEPGPVAPNTIVSLYGTDLAYVTRAIQNSDIRGGLLPTVLPGTGVRVLVNNLSAHIYFVSPRQVNLLIPSNLIAGPAELQLRINGLVGPAIRFTLSETAPGLFLQQNHLAIATRLDGMLYTLEKPARPGDWVILYATGLGRTVPAADPGSLARDAARLKAFSRFGVLLDGIPVEPARIGYAGLAPGYAGLYQVNLLLPEDTGSAPEIRLVAEEATSPAGVKLPVAR